MIPESYGGQIGAIGAALLVGENTNLVDKPFLFTLRDGIYLFGIIAAIVGSFNMAMATNDSKYYPKLKGENLEGQYNQLNAKMDTLLLHFGIKGIENK